MSQRRAIVALSGGWSANRKLGAPELADGVINRAAFTVRVAGGVQVFTESGDYIRTPCRKPDSLAVALNWGIGSSSLNADVKAFVRLHNVRGSNSE